ncbi:MAG: ABC transporter substrate-binding protein [Actinobacteria bacterium]|nr:ABC transporter substrate-binding protein [Actinomycetota bacterium]
MARTKTGRRLWRGTFGRTLLAASVIVGLASAAAGCGGSSITDSSPSSSTLQVTYASFPDYLDPSLSYTIEGLSAMWETYVPLLTYQHKDGAAGTELMPGLARSMPQVSDGDRTYTLYLRKGLKYSDGTSVRASDFPATIERLFVVNSPGSPFFTDIVGAEKFAKTKEGGIAGIETDDKTGRIVIHLVKPRSTFLNELATLFAAPLPADTQRKDLSADPPPGTGPYVIASSKPGDAWTYKRNPEWAKVNGPRLSRIPGGYYDNIDVKVIRNAETAVNEVIKGKVDWMEEPPPADRFQELSDRYEGTQLLVTPQIDVYYFWMNTKQAPFDDLKVRQAVDYAVDPAALERIYGGMLKGVQQVLPEAMPGHKTFELYPHNLQKAREMIAAADPAERKVTVWTNDYPANRQAGEYYEDVLRKIGLQPTLKVISTDNYTTLIGNKSTPDLDTGWAAWYMDYPHPNDYFAPQLSGENILPTGNSNYSQFSDPAINRKIARLGTEQLGPKQEAEYAELDREVMEQAPWAPFGTTEMITFISSSIDPEKLVVSPVYGQDIATFQPH